MYITRYMQDNQSPGAHGMAGLLRVVQRRRTPRKFLTPYLFIVAFVVFLSRRITIHRPTLRCESPRHKYTSNRQRVGSARVQRTPYSGNLFPPSPNPDVAVNSARIPSHTAVQHVSYTCTTRRNARWNNKHMQPSRD
jgi:hypothetical protein